MKKGRKILLAILAGILAVAAIVFVVWFIEYINLPEMDVSESPLGMEWGMSREEVEEILASQPEYSFSKSENMLIYTVANYQDIQGLSGQVACSFDETGGLSSVCYIFRSVNHDGMSTTGAINLAYKSSKKQLKKYYEAPHIFTRVIIELFVLRGGEDWIGEKTLVSTSYEESDRLYLLYEPLEGNEEYVDMLRDPVTYMKNSEE